MQIIGGGVVMNAAGSHGISGIRGLHRLCNEVIQGTR